MEEIQTQKPCYLCPRRCGVERSGTGTAEQYGYCGEGAALRLACASIHRGEEPPLTGAGENGTGGGSGTIFVSGCNLGCVFCQNWQISRNHLGRAVDVDQFTRICLALQERGAENINIVTGSHAVPAIVEGIAAAKSRGLSIPVLWNSSAYELPETLDLLADTVDVFLPDIKTFDRTITQRYCNAPDYPAAAAAAIEKMLELRSLGFNHSVSPPRLVSGVMIRHLVLPGHLEASRKVLREFAARWAGRALLSLMFQYTPVVRPWMAPLGLTSMSNPKGEFVSQTPRIQTPAGPPHRYISRSEYDTVLGWLSEFGIEDGYCQEFTPGNTEWLPDFERSNPFSSDLSIPVWHWKKGFIM